MNHARLEMTIDVLRRVEAQQLPFDMDHWLFSANPDAPCRTAACAFGYAALDPALQAEGLSLIRAVAGGKWETVATATDYNRLILAGLMKAGERVYPCFGDAIGFDAASSFYGITHRAAMWLFDPPSYHQPDIEPADVIARILTVIELDGEAPPEEDDEDEVEQCRPEPQGRVG